MVRLLDRIYLYEMSDVASTVTGLCIYVGTMPSVGKIGELVSEIKDNMIPRNIRFLYIG